jgi:hypothetical protein
MRKSEARCFTKLQHAAYYEVTLVARNIIFREENYMNGCFNDNCLLPILLLCCCGGFGGASKSNSCGCGCGDSCGDSILPLILLLCCCGGFGGTSCDNRGCGPC